MEFKTLGVVHLKWPRKPTYLTFAYFSKDIQYLQKQNNKLSKALLEKGLGLEMGVNTVRRIRVTFLFLQLSLQMFRAHQSHSQRAVDWASSAYQLVAGIGVTQLKEAIMKFLEVDLTQFFTYI